MHSSQCAVGDFDSCRAVLPPQRLMLHHYRRRSSMPHAGAIALFSGGAIEVSILSLAAVLLIALGAWLFLNARQTAAQREQRRRLMVNRIGRMGEERQDEAAAMKTGEPFVEQEREGFESLRHCMTRPEN